MQLFHGILEPQIARGIAYFIDEGERKKEELKEDYGRFSEEGFEDEYILDQNRDGFQGGENDIMARETNDPDDLGRQARDARGSQEDMFDDLSDMGQEVVDTLTDYGVELDNAYDAVRAAENRVGDSLEQQEKNYDAVQDFAAGLKEEVNELLDEEDFARFEREYDQFDNEMGTMDRNRERFISNSDYIE